MKSVNIFATLLLALSVSSFANAGATDTNPCQTSEGRQELMKEYVASGAVVPACGPQCAEAYIISAVCEMKVKPNCRTEAGREAKIQEFIKAGNPVPACGPQCSMDYVLSKVCPAK